MAFWSWSKTAASNATADSTINYAEGQAPSSLNDSARAGMARLAEYRDDIAGTITTGGTSTAYTVTSNQVFDTLAHMNGAMIAFVPHTTSGATVTLNVDGLGAKALRSAPSTELPSGVLVQGTPYVATYVNADSAWYLQGFINNPYNIPIGAMMPWTGDTAPNASFVIPIGQAVNRTTYATYFNTSGVGTRYGTGDGSTTFNLPDVRGRAVFQPDSGGSARITVAGGNFDGTVLGGTGGFQGKVVAQANLVNFALSVTDPGHLHTWTSSNSGQPGNSSTGSSYTNAGGSQISATNTSQVTTGISVATGGSSTPLPIMPPTILLPYILRII